MKKIYLIGLITGICMMTFAFADVFDDISAAIRSGNAKQIGTFFNTTVDLTILNQEDVYGKAQAELILKDFFSKNTPSNFNIKHQGTSKEGAKYVIGNLLTSQGGNFRTYFLLRMLNGKFYIQELRFEEELH
jgi:hypothetical protein